MTHDRDDQPTEQDGQVSELAMAGTEPEPISSADSVAGQPDDEPGDTQEGATGPDGVPVDETGEHPHKP